MLACSVLAALVAVLTIIFHFWALKFLRGLMPSNADHNHFIRSIFILVLLVTVHLIEVFLFTAVIFFIDFHMKGPSFAPPLEPINLEFFYISMISYTTLGLSSSVPVGIMKIIIGIESLVGFIMITWSASFFYAIVEKESKNNSLDQTPLN